MPLLAIFSALVCVQAFATPIQIVATYDKLKDVEARVDGVFETTPHSGFIPLQVRLENPTSRDLTWTLTTDAPNRNSGGLSSSSSVKITCPAGSTVNREVLAPIPPLLEDTWSHDVQVSLILPGHGSRLSYSSGRASPGFPSVALSNSISNGNRNALEKEMGSGSSHSYTEHFGADFDPARLPSDWRGLSGIDVLMMTRSEWQGLSATQRKAVVEWVHLGGTLDLYAKEDLSALSISELGFPDGKQGQIGLGHVRQYSYNQRSGSKASAYLYGGALTPKPLIKNVKNAKQVNNVSSDLSSGFRRGWELDEVLGQRSFKAWLWLLILTAFGILVGPINLFVLTGKARRHRLFITTPIISLVTSLLLGGLIFVIDGLGGKGVRFSAIELQPGQEGRSAYVTQQSLCSTGLLTGTSFTEKHPTVHRPAALSPSRWAHITAGGRGEDRGRLDVTDTNNFHGDWFKSRSRHGFHSTTIVPSRARFELSASTDAPELVSGLGFDVESVCYVDQAGKIWGSTSGVKTGQKVALSEISMADFSTWKTKSAFHAASALQRDLKNLVAQPGHFYAFTKKPTGLESDLVSSIRWNDTSAFVFGPVMASGSAR